MAEAIAWQIKFLVQNLTSKKVVKATTTELQNLIKSYGDYAEKQVLKILMEGIDFKDTKVINGQKESSKLQVLNGELQRISQRQKFICYFSEVSFSCVIGQIIDTIEPQPLADFIADFIKSLKLSFALQIIIGLALTNSRVPKLREEGIQVLMTKLKEYFDHGKPQILPEYCVHQILYLLRTEDAFLKDSFYSNQIANFIIESSPQQQKDYVDYSLLPLKQYQLKYCNTAAAPSTPAGGPNPLGNLLDNFTAHPTMDPADLLLDLGHMTTYNYDELLYVLVEFKNITPEQMASTLIKLANNYQGIDDKESRQLRVIFESCKKGDNTYLNKDVGDKKTSPSWSLDNLARAFRELYSHLNWVKVFESLATLNPNEHRLTFDVQFVDKKAFLTFLQLYNKAKPQNLQFPVASLISQRWKNFSIQFSIIQYALQIVGEKDSIALDKGQNKLGQVDNLQSIKSATDKLIKIWTNIDLVDCLIDLSRTYLYSSVQTLFESPVADIPEHLLLTLVRVKAQPGSFLLDELYSQLLPQFLKPHANSIPIIENIWTYNRNIIIRGMSELYKKDPTQLNLSRVIDITQEIKDSLLPILNNSDYYFSVHLGILAGKREFLHFDEWISERFTTIGSPFINEILQYIQVHVLNPFQQAEADNKKIDKEAVYERSQLNTERIVHIFDKLQSPSTTPNVRLETTQKTMQLFNDLSHFEERLVMPSQSESGIDEEANEHFQKLFSDQMGVDQFLVLIRNFMNSEETRQQEVAACMLHNLFDEYRFFHKYPEKELKTTAVLFGQIIMQKFLIQNHLIDNLAIKYVQQALKRPGKLFQFGLTALEQFYPRLNETPEFYDRFLEIEQVKRERPEIYSYIQKLKEFHSSPNREKLTPPEPPQPPQPVTVGMVKTEEQPASAQAAPAAGAPGRAPQQQTQAAAKETSKKEITGRNTEQQAQDKVAHQQHNPPQHSHSQMDVRSGNRKQLDSQLPSASEQQEQERHFKGMPSMPALNNEEFKRVMDGREMEQQQQQQVRFQHGPPPPHQPQPYMQQHHPGMSTTPQNMMMNHQMHPMSAMQSPYPMGTSPGIYPSGSVPLNTNTSKAFQPSKYKQQKALQPPKRENFNTEGKKPIQIVKELLDFKHPTPEKFPGMNDMVNKKLNFLAPAVITKTIQDLVRANILEENDTMKVLIASILQRISDQDKYIELYSNLIYAFENRQLTNTCIKYAVNALKEMIQYDEEILGQDMGSHSGDSFKPYKNVARFIGTQTLSRNRPLFSKDLDLKQLLYDGFKNQKSHLAVSIVCNILQEGKKSVFNIENPWTFAIVSFMLEIFDLSQDHSTKTAIQIFIEQIDPSLHQIQRTGYLHNTFNNSPFIDKEISHMNNKNSTRPIIYASRRIPTSIPSSQGLPQSSITPDVPSSSGAGGGGGQIASPAPMFTTGLSQSSSMPASSGQAPEQTVSPNTTRMNIQSILRYITINTETIPEALRIMPNYQATIQQIVGEVVTQAIQEILPPVVERSVTIALITTRELVLKDFALDGDEQKVKNAAQHMIQSLAGSLALVTCREPLRMTLTKIFEQKFQQQLSALDAQERNEFSERTSKDNLELGCQLIQRRVIEQASEKLNTDERIQQSLQERITARQQNRRFIDTRNAENLRHLPQLLQPVHTGLSDNQYSVYLEFSQSSLNTLQTRQQPQPTNTPTASSSNHSDSGLSDDTASSLRTTTDTTNTIFSTDQEHQQNREPQSVVALLQNIWIEYINKNGDKQLLRKFASEFQQYLNSLTSFQEQEKAMQAIRISAKQWFDILCQKYDRNSAETEKKIKLLILLISSPQDKEEVPNDLTRQFFTFEEKIVQNIEFTLDMMKNGILSLREWDKGISDYLKMILPQLCDDILTFISNFLKEGIDRLIIQIENIPNLIAVLRKIVASEPYKTLPACVFFNHLIKQYDDRNLVSSQTPTNAASQKKTLSAKERDELKLAIEKHFIDVMESNEDEKKKEKVQQRFEQIHNLRVFKDQERQSIFTQTLVNFIIDKCMFKAGSNGDLVQNYDHSLQYQWIDMFITMMIVFFKVDGTQINISSFISTLLQDIYIKLDDYHTRFQTEFNQKPFYRLIFGTLRLIEFLDPKIHSIAIQEILIAFTDFFHKTNPNVYPAFSFAWLELVSHKRFMPFILKRYDNKKMEQTLQDRWYKQHELLCDLFQFLKCNYFQNQAVTGPMKTFYDGVLRLLVAILHDYPEFFSQYHFNFVNKLPDHFIQLRNIILSAFPSFIDPPEPFQSNLKIDLLPEIKIAPTIASKYQNYLKFQNLKEMLDQYFANTNETQLLDKIIYVMQSCFAETPNQQMTASSIINAVILYVAECTVQEPSKIQNKESMKMVQIMIEKLPTPARDCLLNSIFNEIRYPNSHTYFFLCIILCTFVEARKEIIQEQIARILFERKTLFKPTPWGLMVMMRELLQNNRYEFTKKRFFRSSPDLENFFTSIFRSLDRREQQSSGSMI